MFVVVFTNSVSSVYKEDTEPCNETAGDRDNIIFDICLILNPFICSKLDNTDDEVVLEKQISAVRDLKVRQIRMWFQFNTL